MVLTPKAQSPYVLWEAKTREKNEELAVRGMKILNWWVANLFLLYKFSFNDQHNKEMIVFKPGNG